MGEHRNTDSPDRPSTARRTLLTGGIAGLAAVAGTTFGRAQPASAATTPPSWITPTGNKSGGPDTQNINDALASTGIALLAPGTFYVVESPVGSGPAISLQYGQALRGCNDTVLMYLGNAQCVYAHSQAQATGPADLQVYPQNIMGPEVSGLTIDGSLAGEYAVGLDVGDGDDGFIWRVRTAHFNQANQYGMLILNRYDYTEKWRIYTQHFDCQNPVVIGADLGLPKPPLNPASTSFMYNDFEFHINALTGVGNGGTIPVTQNGVAIGGVIQTAQGGVTYGHANLANARLCIRGNWQNPGLTAGNLTQNPSFALSLGVTGDSSHPAIARCLLDIAVETDGSGSGANLPTTILFNDTGSVITNCTGRLVFNDGWTSTNLGGSSNPGVSGNPGLFSFAGPIVGDPYLSGISNTGFATPGTFSGAPIVYAASNFNVNNSGNANPQSGDFFSTTLGSDISVHLNNDGGVGGPQRKTFVISQPGSEPQGGWYTVAWPSNTPPTLSLTKPTVLWPGGTAPGMTAKANATDVYKLETLDGVTWYGEAVQDLA